MQIDIRSSFEKDTKKLSDTVKEDIAEVLSAMLNAKTLSDIPNLKDMKGGKKGKRPFRVRIGDYRICFYLVKESIELVRVLPRKEVYKVFP